MSMKKQVVYRSPPGALGVFLSVLLCLVSPVAMAAELMTHKNVTISVADDYACGSSAQIRLDAAHEDEFHRSRSSVHVLIIHFHF